MNFRPLYPLRENARGFLRGVVLTFYFIYALSPLYCTFQPVNENIIGGRHPSGQASVGIVWLNVLISSFTHDAQASEGRAAARLAAASCDDMILIKKRRAVLREQREVRPLNETVFLPRIDRDCPETASRYFDVRGKTGLQVRDGHVAPSTGLSPPLPRS